MIGETYVDAPSDLCRLNPLPACANDARGIATMLSSMSATPYQVKLLLNPTMEEMHEAIWQAFSQATEDDLCLFFYSGHGLYDTGDLLPYDFGVEGYSYSLYNLRNDLTEACGNSTKLVLLDSCYSGNILSPDSGAKTVSKAVDLDAINRNVISVFSSGSAKALDDTDPKFMVITASRKDEESWASNTFSFFTAFLNYGCGYDMFDHEQMKTMPADSSKDGFVTHNEAYRYTKKEVSNFLLSNSGGEINQHAMCWPENCQEKLFGQFAVTSGFNAKWKKDGKGLSFGSNIPAEELKSVLVDGKTVSPANYTVTVADDGTAIVTLSDQYLSTLKGKHELSLTYGSKKAVTFNSAAFYADTDVPITGDPAQPLLCGGLLLLSALALFLLRRRRAC